MESLAKAPDDLLPSCARPRRRSAARFAPENGRWELLFETRDESQWRTELQRLRCTDHGIDLSTVRIDTLCGRLTRPTTYRLSRFVPNAAPDPNGD